MESLNHRAIVESARLPNASTSLRFVTDYSEAPQRPARVLAAAS
jgi:hypothetical protein